MNKKRILENKAIDKTFVIELSEKLVKYQTVKNGKGRLFEKNFDSQEKALDFFNKKEWEMLKKDFIFSDENADFGNPILHYFTSSGYTGCLSFENTPNGIYVYKDGSYNGSEKETDFIDLIDKKGNLIKTIELPDILPWDIQYNLKNNLLLLNLDHHIYSFNIENDSFEKNADGGTDYSPTFIFSTDELFAYATNKKLLIKDNNNHPVLERNYSFEIINGNSFFCGAISKNNKILALHSKIGEIELIDIKTNQLIKILKGNFEGLEKMIFVENDQTIILQKSHQKPLLYIDIEESKEIEYPNLGIKDPFNGVSDFCLNKDETKLALAQGKEVYIYDFKNKKYIDSLRIEHAVSTVKIKFIDNDLGVRTDYGCFSLYKV